MRFKDLTEELIVKMREIHASSLIWDEKMAQLMELTGVSERTCRKWLVKLGIKNKEDIIPPELEEAKKRKHDKSKKRFIITWAQNDTQVHSKFLDNIEAYANKINGAIHIIAGRYKNPTSVANDAKHESWHSRAKQYLDANRHDIHKYVSIMSDIKTQPTAVNPMSGMEGVSGVNSCIFGHPKLQMQTIPVLEGNKPKMMLTTGACTVSNYTDSKSGKKGEFHHTLGFVIVEIKDNDTFFVRQVSAEDNGDFTDLYYDVRHQGYSDEELETPKVKITKQKTMSGIVLGDLHWGHHDPAVIKGTEKLMKKLKPEHVVLHDVFDGNSISHHEMKDPFAQYKKEVHGTNSLRDELDSMLDGLSMFEKYDNVVIVRSNHDDFLDRWLKNGDWKKQPTPKNSMEYMLLSAMLLSQYANDDDVKGVIPELINHKYPDFITLGRRDTYKIHEWECAHHGDVGSNGSRGSLIQFRKLNTKVIVGHYHAPQRKDGALAVGTSTYLRVGYNDGASAWLNTHVIIHESGKAQHINFIDGEYTTFK